MSVSVTLQYTNHPLLASLRTGSVNRELEPELVCCTHSGASLDGCVFSLDLPSKQEQGLFSGGTSI